MSFPARSRLASLVASALVGLVATQAAEVTAIPVFVQGARILFQGDSITDGNRGRNTDPNHILGHGYAFIIAARYGAAYPAQNLVFLNRGISGNKVSDLEKRWSVDTLALKPDVLSVLIGVNDASATVPLEEFERGYDKLLTDLQGENPKVRLVLGEPFTLPVGRKKETWETWSAQVAALRKAVGRLAAKHDAALVPFQQVFDEACKRAPADYWIWDGVHPTYSGHELMADAWVRAVQAKWRKP